MGAAKSDNMNDQPLPDAGHVFLTQLAGEWMCTRHENMKPYLRATFPPARGCCAYCITDYIKREALKGRNTIELQSVGVKWVYRGFDKKVEAHVRIGQTYQFWDGLHGHEVCETCEFDAWTQTLTRMWTPGKKHERPDGLVKATFRLTASGELEIETTFNPTGVTMREYLRKCGGPTPVQPAQPVQPQPVQLQDVQPLGTFDYIESPQP